MRLLKRILLTFVLLIAAAAGTGWWLVQRQVPDLGAAPIPGLGGEVRVSFDTHGVPTIRAATLLDAMRIQGYLAARERLFQMELLRRSADGTLAEIVGASALGLDRRRRTFGFRQVAEAAVPLLPAAERDAAAAYAAGVNAFIGSHPGRWGIEFQLLGITPRPWTVADSLKVLLIMHEDLSTSWREELQHALLQALPAERRALLMPQATEEDVLLVPDADPAPVPPTRLIAAPVLRAAAELLDDPSYRLPFAGVAGSNNWVVAGTRTASGKPMLANDPHLGLMSPGTWYPIRIEWQGRYVQGVSLPGGPGVVIGHNDRIAWGFTNLMTDVQDLYWEDPEGERIEQIPVKGRAAETHRVPLGRHGPQLRPGLSLHWAALDPSRLRNPFLSVDSARDWTEFNAALDGFLGPAQNAVYADRDGHIGWRATGLIPLRKPGDDGSLPKDGKDPGNDWRGFLPQSAMPRLPAAVGDAAAAGPAHRVHRHRQPARHWQLLPASGGHGLGLAGAGLADRRGALRGPRLDSGRHGQAAKGHPVPALPVLPRRLAAPAPGGAAGGAGRLGRSGGRQQPRLFAAVPPVPRMAAGGAGAAHARQRPGRRSPALGQPRFRSAGPAQDRPGRLDETGSR